MKKAELFTLYHGLQAVTTFPGVKFAYAVARNIAAVVRECECLEKAVHPSAEFVEYDQMRIALAIDMCDKNEDGSPVITSLPDGQQVYAFGGQTSSPAWNAAVSALNEKYEAVIAARRSQVAEYEAMLRSEDSDVVLIKVTTEQLPEGINALQISAIMAIIEGSM